MTAVRLLIVDDSAQVRRDLATLLPLAGEIEIVGAAADGQEAVELAQALRPAVVLLDLAMPVMSGYEAARQIKTLLPGCRLVALTVHAYPDARQKASQAGIDAFLVKGLPVDELVQTIFAG